MLFFALCEDNAYFLRDLQQKVQQYVTAHQLAAQISCFGSGEELLAAKTSFDLILMDLKLPGKGGLEVIEELRGRANSGQVIFITSYPQYALKAFDLDAIHYLLKPITEENLYRALDKALQRSALQDSGTLVLTTGTRTQRIFLRDILYCEALDHKLYIHTTGGTYDTFGTMEQLLLKLDKRFFQCHRSYLINLSFVVNKDRDTVTVSGGDQILVSRRKQRELTQKLLDYFRKEVF